MPWSRAQYAARRLVLVKVDLPKGTGGLTGHSHASHNLTTVPLARVGTEEVGGWLFFATCSCVATAIKTQNARF